MIPLFDVKPPEDFMSYYGNLMTVLNFEVYNAGNDISAAIGLPAADPPAILAEKLNLLGMESTNFIENDGNFLFIYGILLLGVAQIFASYICLKEISYCKRLAKKFKQSLFFNSFIVLWNEALLMTSVCLILGFEHMSFETGAQTF